MAASARSKALELYEAALTVPEGRDSRRGVTRGKLKRVVKSVVLGEQEKNVESKEGPGIRESSRHSQHPAGREEEKNVESKEGPGMRESSRHSQHPAGREQEKIEESKEGPVCLRVSSRHAQPPRGAGDIRAEFALHCSSFDMRPFQITDISGLVLHGNEDAVSRWLRNHFPSPYTKEAAKIWIQSRSNDVFPFTHLAITVNGQCCGGISIDIDQGGGEIDSHNGEIGYWIGTSFANQGIMSEAVGRFTRYVFESIPSILNIKALVFSENRPSIRILEKNGFLRCGNIPSYFCKGKKYYDAELYIKQRDGGL